MQIDLFLNTSLYWNRKTIVIKIYDPENVEKQTLLTFVSKAYDNISQHYKCTEVQFIGIFNITNLLHIQNNICFVYNS